MTDKTKEEPVESAKEQEKIDGKFKPGQSGNPAGRKKGSLNKKTKDQKIIEEEFRNRILTNIYDLLTAQMNIAKGASYLYRIDESGEGSKKKREHILVTDPDEIREVLDELEGDETGTLDECYYYITTKTPDNKALDSLIDRVFGKANQPMDIAVENKVIIVDL